VALGVWIRSGSRSEPTEQAGISHFIEHLLFKGSDRYSAYDIARIFDEMGGEPNAATSKEHTVVYARLLDDDLEQACKVMSEMVVRPSFANLDAEREVVLEEVAMYEDSPPELIHDYITEAVFGHHPLGRSVIGTADTLEAQDLPAVQDYHREHYVRPSVVVAAAGSVDHDRLRALAGELYGDLPAGEGAQTPPFQPPERHEASFVQKDTEQYHVCLGGPALRRDDPRRHALFVVDTLLGGSWSSRLFQEVRDERGLAYSVYSYASLYSDTGMAGIYFGSREEAVGEAMAVILQELRDITARVPDEEIARAKKHLKGQLVLSMESPQSRMQSLGRNVLFDMPVLTVDEMLARIEAVTVADVQEVTRDFYDTSRWSAVCIGPRPEAFKAVAGGFDWQEP
jgi:predicted Zn-dependent peptidase